MTTYLLDTHTWAWGIKYDSLLPQRVAQRILDADTIEVSAISLYEIAQKVTLGKWPDMEPHADHLAQILSDQGGHLVVIDAAVAQLAGMLQWNHRDPFDRMLAATSIIRNVPILSADTVFDALSDRKDWPGRIW